MLPFTPANRNNLIGWIAGRSDADHYGDVDRLRLSEDAARGRAAAGRERGSIRTRSCRASCRLWNQQGSRVRRGPLLVIPIGRALLYAEAIYLQADRSPMPELRLVVRWPCRTSSPTRPTFEAALAGLMGGAASPAAAPCAAPRCVGAAASRARLASGGPRCADRRGLPGDGGLSASHRGRPRSGEAGQKLEQLKRTLDELSKRRR